MLCVCGDVTPEQVEKVADKILPVREQKKIERSYRDEPAEINKKKVTAQFEIARPMFYIGIKDMDIPKDPIKRMHNSTAGAILFDMLFGTTSEFSIDVFESGLIRNFNASFELDHVYGMGALYGETDDTDKVYEKFCSYIDGKKKTGLSREDFDMAKRAYYAGYVRLFESTRVADTFTFIMHDGCDIFEYGDASRSVEVRRNVQGFKISYFDEKYYANERCRTIKK